MAIVTMSEARAWLGISGTYTADDDFVLAILIAAIDRLFADVLGYSISSATRTEYYPMRVNLQQRDALVEGFERQGTKIVSVDRYQNERRVLALRHLPVTEIIGVWENSGAWDTAIPDFGDEFLLDPDGDYRLDQETLGTSLTGFLVRNIGPWSVAERCIKVTYTAGLTAEQLADQYAQLKWAFLTQLQISYNTNKVHRSTNSLGAGFGMISSESLGDWSASYDTLTNSRLYGLQNNLAPAVLKVLEDKINYSAFVF